MRNMVLVGLLATGLSVPVSAYAQTAAPATRQAISTASAIDPLWLAIGAGVVVGAVVFEAVLDTNIAYIIGGAVGGYLANVWYGGYDIRITATPKG
jgi:hypothetical protein